MDFRPSRRPARERSLLSPARAVWGLCVLLLLFPFACGYRLKAHSGSRYADPGIRVDLRTFANESLVPDAGAFLASRLREEMRRNGFRGRFERSMSDYLIEGTVREIREEVISHGQDDLALEHRLTISVDIRVV